MKRKFPDSNLGQSIQVDTYSEVPARTSIRTVPFDYVVTLELTGIKNTVLQNVINVSVEGNFVATGISYSLLVDERRSPINFAPAPPDAPEVIRSPAEPRAAYFIGEVEIHRGTPGVKTKRFKGTSKGFIKIFGEPNAKIQLFVNQKNVLKDTTKLDGDGRITLRGITIKANDVIEVRDITHNLSSGKLVVSRIKNTFYITPQIGPLEPFPGSKHFEIVGSPGEEVTIHILDKTGTTRTEVEPIVIPKQDDDNHEAGLLKIELDPENTIQWGDKIIVRYPTAHIHSEYKVPDNPLKINIGAIPLDHLTRGFRLHPSVARALRTETQIPDVDLDKPFISCVPDNLEFLYAIIDNGPERELQSQPIHNIAGLGIANGDRPFRVFPKPIVFAPRSVILFRVREISGGPGTLYFVLQGYKVLGTAGARIPE